MMKHERQQACAKTNLPFIILTSIMKELADMMQVWTLNGSMCPAAVRQSPDSTLNLHVNFYIWMKKSSPKDVKIFKQ